MTKHKLSPEAEAAFLRELITQIEFRGELGLTPFGAHGRYQEKLYAIATELEGHG
jgi:hypothetical protein